MLTLSAETTTHAQDLAPPDSAVAPVVASDATAANATDAAVKAVYSKAGKTAVWTAADADALNRALADRARHGLDRVVFLTPPPEGASAGDQDVALTRAALGYAGALAHGRVDPGTLHDVYTLDRPKTDVAAGLVVALQKGTLSAWLDSLAPQDSEYRQLSESYLQVSQRAATAPPVQAIPAGLIKIGNRDPRVRAVRDQLAESGYMTGDAGLIGGDAAGAVAAPIYTDALADAVKRLQTDYGIAADGVIGPDTLRVLNLGADDRARALAVALERRRWLARTTPATRIDVNTAASELRYYRDGVLVDRRKVIVGEPGHETPSLASPIYRLVANPTWTIPKSIQNGEMANVDDAYLEAHDMVMRDGWIVQQPGPSNALGMVKFDMANNQAIYLHDTSAPALFDRSQRHLSHGCVRVDDALGFAQMLADDEGVSEQWQQAQASGEMTFVPLPKRIPVRMLYHNVFVDDGGTVAYRTDPYGWNAPVAGQLGFGAAAAKRAAAPAIDIGP
ncbi:L,D-transpeptidase family protein [Sphingomonas sp. PB2P19]|uniref:L,D-transpeptidase family protein n=1 Tax=Sphingomonas rhamnosi TaxID=3096156 RepID=UPI002FC6D0EB